MDAEGVVGQRTAGDGSDLPYRLTRYLAIAVAEAHGLYYDAISRGNCFYASQQAAAALGTALTATAVTMTLYNPTGSQKNLQLMEVQLAVPVATTAGQVVYAVNGVAGQVAPTGTTVLASGIQNALIGGGTNPVGVVYSAATLPAAPIARRVLAGIVSTTPGGVHSFVDRPGMILQPGMMVTIQGITTNATGIISFLWEEVTP